MMKPPSDMNPPAPAAPDIKDLIERLMKTYEAMSAAYEESMKYYGFDCRGCDDNCCSQHFYHHTLIEHHCLMQGLKAADAQMRAGIIARTREKAAAHEDDGPVLCPVNSQGLCALYEHRPMICRLHGLPHEFTRPDGKKILGGGCARFAEHIGDALPEHVIDRTPFYTSLAAIEKDLRIRLGRMDRFRRTTREMLLCIAAELDEDAPEEDPPSQGS